MRSVPPARHGDAELLDVRELGRDLARGWRWVLGGVLLGAAVALAVTLLLPPEFEASGTVVLDQRRSTGAPSVLRTSELADLFQLPGVGGSSFDTELEILRSRSNIGKVVESLGLQVWVEEPEATPADSLFSAVTLEADVREGEYRFRRDGDAYGVSGPEGYEARVASGGELRIPGATLRLRPSPPETFTVTLMDRDAAVRQVERTLEAGKAGGDVAEVVFRAPDPWTAATVPNALIAAYMEGVEAREGAVDQDRLTVVETLTDSLRTELEVAGTQLRRYHEREGTFDPDRIADVERAAELRARADELEVEVRALDRILDRAPDTLSMADLVAFPTFLESAAINTLVDRIQTLHTERTSLLQRRTESDPDVQLMTRNIRYLEGELLALVRSYRENVVRSLQGVSQELEERRRALAPRPAEEQARFELEGEVERLTASYLGLQSQLVQLKLAAIRDEATRQVDVATPPREAAFPRPLLNLGVGLAGGLLLGVLGALVAGQLRERVTGPRQVSALIGVPAVWFGPERPVLLGGLDERATVLVVPVGGAGGAEAVARRIAETSVLRGRESALLDLTVPRGGLPPAERDEEQTVEVAGAGRYQLYPSSYALDTAEEGPESRIGGLRSTLDDLEARFPLVIVALPGTDAAATAALVEAARPVVLVAEAGTTALSEIEEAVEGLERLGVSVSAVVVRNGSDDGDRP